MKIQVVKFGRPAFSETKSLAEMYRTRLSSFARVEGLELKDEPEGRGRKGSVSFFRSLESPDHLVVALDERGREYRSEDFARRLSTWQDDPAIKCISFVIGGPFGLPDVVRHRANELWSLSQATLQGDLAWVLCWEQIYRAFNILRGTDYHHD